MKIISGVDFYAKDDVLYSHGGFVALDDQLNPCGIFIPGVKGHENVQSTDELDSGDAELTALATSYKTIVGQ